MTCAWITMRSIRDTWWWLSSSRTILVNFQQQVTREFCYWDDVLVCIRSVEISDNDPSEAKWTFRRFTENQRYDFDYISREIRVSSFSFVSHAEMLPIQRASVSERVCVSACAHFANMLLRFAFCAMFCACESSHSDATRDPVHYTGVCRISRVCRFSLWICVVVLPLHTTQVVTERSALYIYAIYW